MARPDGHRVGHRRPRAARRPPPTATRRGWPPGATADAQAAEAIDAALGDELSEPRVARELGARLDEDATLYVASSMPVRDVESFFPARDEPPRVLANRGANGIDGTVSSAFGAAAAGARTLLLIGDVALAYDVGGLLAAKRHGLALTIVLLNNDGGGIFEFLPISGEGDVFEEHVATPHGLDFAHAAALYGLRHTSRRHPRRASRGAIARAGRRSSRSAPTGGRTSSCTAG